MTTDVAESCVDAYCSFEFLTFLNRETFPKKSRLIQNIVVNEPVFLKEPLLFAIIDAIAVCVINSELLSTLFLEALPLNDNYAKILNNSINKQRNLQNLTLSYCSLSEENIATLCRIICRHTGLQKIDLTGSGITYNGAKEISAVIKSQKFARYSESWKQSLRYRLPNPDILPGLRRITLNNNRGIGDEGFKIICYELLDDLWIKAIDFQNCNLTNSSTEDALLLLKINPNIKIIDVRKNDISNDIIKTILDRLKKNTSNDNDDSYGWIDSSNSLMSSPNSYNTQQMSVSPAIKTKSFYVGMSALFLMSLIDVSSYQSGKMAATAVEEKAFCVLELAKTNSVTIVHRRFTTKYGVNHHQQENQSC
ncbi:centrosomal protein of 78 kDa-like [Lycorma delicatula]|uniref:centrosomal protein of 78 kDa-like n=1 Tax=Lycorma delicatula TaxID=130591 RepID=UPI003F513CA2